MGECDAEGNAYIFRTHDCGKTWTKITAGLPAHDYVHAVREDLTRRGLLYAATQHGVYLSYDDGDSWQSLSLNLPDVPVSDLIVQSNSLAISTHGRGFYILDDINALRQFSRTSLANSSCRPIGCVPFSDRGFPRSILKRHDSGANRSPRRRGFSWRGILHYTSEVSHYIRSDP